MPKPLTNKQIMGQLMSSSQYGPLAQAFILNAIYSAAVATVDAGTEALGEDNVVSPDAWVGVADEIKQKLDKLTEQP